jgi:hypothetical protein
VVLESLLFGSGYSNDTRSGSMIVVRMNRLLESESWIVEIRDQESAIYMST